MATRSERHQRDEREVSGMEFESLNFTAISRRSSVADAIRKGAPQFGFTPSKKVVPLRG
jgi:hypothetical protein